MFPQCVETWGNKNIMKKVLMGSRARYISWRQIACRKLMILAKVAQLARRCQVGLAFANITSNLLCSSRIHCKNETLYFWICLYEAFQKCCN
jgi:hypothetical protein